MRVTLFRVAIGVGLVLVSILGSAAAAGAAGCVPGVAGATSAFTFTGAEQCYTPPVGVMALHVVATGAAGGIGRNSGSGGNGATVIADVTIAAGQTLYVEVGGAGSEYGFAGPSSGGFNGGAAGGVGGFGSGGGGATDLRKCSIASPSCVTAPESASDPRLIVAGGGGGSGDDNNGGSGGFAGAVGDAGAGASGAAQGGSGGSSRFPGFGGLGGSGGSAGSDGTDGVGGQGGLGTVGGGGGGGGGYWGGGGGGGGDSNLGGGGGGGSSFGPTGAVFGTAPNGVQASLTITPYASSSSGPTGPTGPQGPAGPEGATGATGPRGPAGQVELVTCRTVMTTVKRKRKKVRVTRLVCSTKLVTGPVKFKLASGDQRASLSRAGFVYATGYARRARRGLRTWLLAARNLVRGRYTLTLTSSHGPRPTTSRQQVTVS